MLKTPRVPAALLLAVLLAGCASRAIDVRPAPASPEEFAAWSCTAIDEELDAVQLRAADLAYTVDERAGNNILALGVGLAVFWPAMLALKPDGLEAAELARLRGRFEALQTAARTQSCPLPTDTLPASRSATLPLALGERLVYEQRTLPRGSITQRVLTVSAIRRSETEFTLPTKAAPVPAATSAPQPGSLGAELPQRWSQDRMGNIVTAPTGELQWSRLLRGELKLGAVTAGDIVVVGDPLARARVRGQVVAVGPQTIAGRRFDVAVIELFGDAQRGEAYTRVDGAIVVDRPSGLLLRLDLRSAHEDFSLQRRLVRIDAPLP